MSAYTLLTTFFLLICLTSIHLEQADSQPQQFSNYYRDDSFLTKLATDYTPERGTIYSYPPDSRNAGHDHYHRSYDRYDPGLQRHIAQMCGADEQSVNSDNDPDNPVFKFSFTSSCKGCIWLFYWDCGLGLCPGGGHPVTDLNDGSDGSGDPNGGSDDDDDDSTDDGGDDSVGDGDDDDSDDDDDDAGDSSDDEGDEDDASPPDDVPPPPDVPPPIDPPFRNRPFDIQSRLPFGSQRVLSTLNPGAKVSQKRRRRREAGDDFDSLPVVNSADGEFRPVVSSSNGEFGRVADPIPGLGIGLLNQRRQRRFYRVQNVCETVYKPVCTAIQRTVCPEVHRPAAERRDDQDTVPISHLATREIFGRAYAISKPFTAAGAIPKRYQVKCTVKQDKKCVYVPRVHCRKHRVPHKIRKEYTQNNYGYSNVYTPAGAQGLKASGRAIESEMSISKDLKLAHAQGRTVCYRNQQSNHQPPPTGESPPCVLKKRLYCIFDLQGLCDSMLASFCRYRGYNFAEHSKPVTLQEAPTNSRQFDGRDDVNSYNAFLAGSNVWPVVERTKRRSSTNANSAAVPRARRKRRSTAF